MANTLNLGNGNWGVKKDSLLAYNSENENYKPLPFDFTRASSATVVNKAGLIETVGSGIPRIDFKDNTKGALLLEPTRSNVLPHSNNYDEWAKGNSTVTSGQIGVGGSLDAWKLQKNASGGYVSRGGFSYDGVSTFSIFAKAGSVDWLRVTSQSGSFKFNVNLSNGEVGVTGSLVTSTSVEYYGNGWYRCTATGNSLANGFYIKPAETDDNTNGVDGSIFIQNAQVETNSSYATSYIPTSGSAVTRIADVCNNAGNDQVFNSSEGVLYIEADILKTSGTGFLASISNGLSLSESINIRQQSSGTLSFQLSSGGSNTFINTTDWSEGINKIALRYNSTGINVYINGNSKGINSAITYPNMNNLDIASRPDQIGQLIELLKVKDVRVYNTTLTDAELQALTQ